MTYWVSGLGWVPWARARAEFARMTCAWADLDGWHIAAAPDNPPLTTHLWAWSPGRWARVRMDGESGVVGLLSYGREGDEQVEVRLRGARPWGTGALRIPATSDRWLDTGFTLLDVAGLCPVTFVHQGIWDPPPFVR